jgi:UDP-N-acetylglucosamine:LPS N-acetylglucosamine transferase
MMHGEPDLVIATHSVVAFIAKRRLGARVPVICHVTDAGDVNRIWFQGNVDMFLVVDHASTLVAKSCGVNGERIALTGPPIANDLVGVTKESARRQLGVPESFVVLFTAGGSGLGQGVLRAARALAASKMPAFALLNAGNNVKLATEFAQLDFAGRSLVSGFDTEFLMQLMACDVVVGKAGMMTLTEAIVGQRPTMIVDVLPGQEERNRDYAISRGAAIEVDPDQVPKLIEQYATNPKGFAAAFDLEQAAVGYSEWPEQLIAAVGKFSREGWRSAGVGRD